MSILTHRNLVYVTTFDHRNTFESLPPLLQDRDISASVCSYEWLFRVPFAVGGTYIFTDFDRLSPSELEVAVRIYERLRESGLRVLNDPRRFLPRDVLIKRLHLAGLNQFTCHLPALDESPTRFPVFLRTIAGHRGVLSGLLSDLDAANTALDEVLAAGFPIRDLVFIEYAAEPNSETGGFQKHSAFKVGDRIFRANTVNDTSWMAKSGSRGIATADQYRAERQEMDSFSQEAFAKLAFGFSGLDFGRLDFGIVDGQPQAYEINSNPFMKFTLQHENSDRAETMQLMETRLANALTELVEPASLRPVSLRGCFHPSKSILRGPRRF